MKKCINCNCEIDDGIKFCTVCGAKQITATTQEQEEKTFPEMQKGFKGFWWNLKNCGKFSPDDQKIVMKKTFVTLLISLIPTVVLITAILFGATAISDAIESSKRYTYMSTEEFIENWNTAADKNPDGITSGVKLSEDDLMFVQLNDTDEIDIDTKGADITSISFESSVFKADEYDGYGKIEEFLRIVFPQYNDTEISKLLKEYKADEEKRAVSGVCGFVLDFEEVESPEDFRMNIRTNYSYTNNIIKSDLPQGCVYDCSLEEFKNNHNQKIDEFFDAEDIESGWYINNFAVFGEEDFMDRKIIQYGFVYYANSVEIASVYLFVDSKTDKIVRIEYQTFYDTEALTDEEFEICFKTIPTCILTSLGFSEYGLYDNYILKVINSAPESVYYEGVGMVGAGIPSRNLNMFAYRPCSEAYFEADKNGKLDEYIENFETEMPQKKESNVDTTALPDITTEATTEADTQVSTTSVTVESQNTTQSFIEGKTFVSAGDFSPACDYGLVNSVAFGSDKATLQINLIEYVVTVETNYTVEGKNVILGEVLTEVGDVMINEGTQFVYDMNVLTVKGMTERFALSGWSCPYQFNDGESFLEVEM